MKSPVFPCFPPVFRMSREVRDVSSPMRQNAFPGGEAPKKMRLFYKNTCIVAVPDVPYLFRLLIINP